MTKNRAVRRQTTLRSALLLAILVPLAGTPVLAEDHDHHHHHHAAVTSGVTVSEASYALPKVTLVRQDGSKAALPAELDDGRPVVLNFMYTSCTAICPMTTQVFAQLQGKLGADRDKVHMVSVSIDPEYDTPARLAEYAKKFSAGSQWTFYGGSAAASIEVQKAFAAYRGDKMNHQPITFIRPAPGKPWSRMDGMATADEILKEYRRVTGG